MLDFLRKRKRSWIITFLLGLIIVVFIAFYGGSKYQNQGATEVATVNGEIISQREFATEYQRALDRYREINKISLTPEMIKSMNIKGLLLEELIQKRLLLQEARSLGLTVTDDELAYHLAQVPDFQVGGRFNKERYLRLLGANRLSPVDFEEEQRGQLTIQRLYGVILDSVHVIEAELRNRYRHEQENINLYFVRLPTPVGAEAAKPSEDDIKTFYERNKESLKEPLKLEVEYLTYPFDQFGANIQASEKEIEEYYQVNRDSKFRQPKQFKLRYIAVPVAPGADAKQTEDTRARAQNILAQARGGKDFAQLAKQFSNEATAVKSGEVGWITATQLPPAITSAIAKLEKGQVSDLIENPGGFQIVKMEDVKEEKTPALKEVTPEIGRILKAEKAKREAGKVADRDRVKALSGAELAALAKESGVAANVTRPFGNGEVLPEIGQNQEFYKSAFALGPKDVSAVIEGDRAYYLLKIKQRREPAVPPLEAVKAKIEKGLAESKAHELLLQKANGLLEQLKKEKDIAKLANENSVKLEETGWFLRNARQLPKLGEISDPGAALSLSAQKPIAERVVTDKNSAYLFAFKEGRGADMERFEKEKEALTKQALSEARQRIAQRFVEGLKAKAKIEIHAGSLDES